MKRKQPTGNPIEATARLDAIEATGRAVNSADVASIEGAAGTAPREFAYTYADLARKIGVSISGLKLWRKQNRDFPQRTFYDGRERWNVAEVRDYMKAKGLNERAAPVEDETKALMRELIRSKIKSQNIKNQIADGKVIPERIVAAGIAAGTINAKNELLRIPQMAIELVGLSAPDIEKKLRAMIVGALKTLYAGPTPEMRAKINKIVAEVERKLTAKEPKTEDPK